MSTDHAVTVRAGAVGDVEAATTILSAADARRTGSQPHPAAGRDRTRRRLAGPDTFFFVAQSAGRDLIGLAAGMSGRQHDGAGSVIPGLCHISMVAVHPEHWGKGVGRRLLQVLLSHGSGLGYDRFQLFTHADNTRAQRLYEGLGFTLTGQTAVSEHGERIVHYLLGERQLDTITT